MTRNWPLLLGSAMYIGLAALIPVAWFLWTDYTGRPLTRTVVLLGGGLFLTCAFLAFGCMKAQTGSRGWTHSVAVVGALLLGNTATVNWKGLLIFGIPFVITLAGIWKVFRAKNAG